MNGHPTCDIESKHFPVFGQRLPAELRAELAALEQRLASGTHAHAHPHTAEVDA